MNNYKWWDGDGGDHSWLPGERLPADADLFKIDFHKQFIDAISLRINFANAFMGYSNLTFLPAPDVSFDGHSAAYFGGWLDKIGELCDFGQRRDPFEQRSLFPRSGGVDFPVLNDMDIPDAYSSTTITQDVRPESTEPMGITCKTDDGSSTEYRRPAAGDIFGAWIFEDIRAYLEKTRFVFLIYPSPGGNQSGGSRRKGVLTGGFPDAYQQYVANWRATPWTDPYSALDYLFWLERNPPPFEKFFFSVINQMQPKIAPNFPGAPFAYKASLYLYGLKPATDSNLFADVEQIGVKQEKLSIFAADQEVPASGGVVDFGYIGLDAAMPFPSEPGTFYVAAQPWLFAELPL